MQAVDIEQTKGFTFLEVIAVMALISILTLVVLARQQTSNTSLPARTQVLKAHLRYTQSRAMNNDELWWIRFNRTNLTYEIFNAGILSALPGEDGGLVDLTSYGISGLDCTPACGNVFFVSFDSWGRPCSDNGETPTPFNSNQALTLRDADGNTESVVITKNTGFIP